MVVTSVGGRNLYKTTLINNPIQQEAEREKRRWTLSWWGQNAHKLIGNKSSLASSSLNTTMLQFREDSGKAINLGPFGFHSGFWAPKHLHMQAFLLNCGSCKNEFSPPNESQDYHVMTWPQGDRLLRKVPKMWQFPCIGNMHMRVQTWDLGEGCGKPAFATRSLEGNEKRRLFVSKNIIYFIFEINLLKKTERKNPAWIV